MKRILVLIISICGLFQSVGAWRELTRLEIMENHGNLTWKAGGQCGIRRVCLHIPECIENKPIALILVHGTYAANSIEYYDDSANFFPRLQECAERLATTYKAPVKIIFYRWSGLNSDEARKEAAKPLVNLIDGLDASKIITVGHSHGGNLINYASNFIKRTIDLMIHFAVPVMFESEDYKPNNFTLLCNFYSSNDIIHMLGAHANLTRALKTSIRSRSLASLAASREYTSKFVGARAGRVVNINTRFKGSGPDHSMIKNGIIAIPHILEALSLHYKLHHDFDLNLDSATNNEPPLLVLRNTTLTSEEALKEVAYSAQQQELFKKRYGRDLSLEKPVSYFSVVANTLLLIPPLRALAQRSNFHTYMPELSHIMF